MQPDTAIKPSGLSAYATRLPVAWRAPLAGLVAAIGALVIIASREWGEMFHQWWDIDTYNHILLIPLILVWLVVMKAQDFARLTPRPWLPGLGIVASALGLWLVGRITDINLFAHAGAVGAVQGAIVAVLGLRVALFAALPLCFIAFAVPFGDEMIPFLQSVTAEIAITLTRWSGIPAVVDGIYIDTPVGLFIVAEECSGVKFLIAMVTLAVMVCFTRFTSWKRRAMFMAASVIVPVIANGIRAWGTIYIAQFQGVEFAAGVDHVVYGWVFFAVVVAIVIAGAGRFFEREPEEHGWSIETLENWNWLARAEKPTISPGLMSACIAAMAITGAVIAAIVAPVAIG